MKSGIIAIAGRPNAGKSTLLNFVIGSPIAIISPKAQTTRDRLHGVLTEPEMGQMVFVDTPGIHRAREHSINSYMMGEVRTALQGPDAIWYLVAPDSALEHEEVVLETLSDTQAPVLLIFNKADLKILYERIAPLQKILLEEMNKRSIPCAGVFEISAKKEIGVSALMTKTWELLPEGPYLYPDEDTLTDRPMRYFVAEKIREQLFIQLGEELPYACAVRIDEFKEDPDLPRIQATIVVERDSQKGMLIGKGGSKIKSIGQAARLEAEKLIGQKIYLGLKVDVLKNWSRNPDQLKELGYVLPKGSPG